MLKLELKETTGKLPTSIFNVVDEKGNTLSYVQVRHQISDGIGVPNDCASHIYYEINPSERGRGYGTEALKLALTEARKVGIRPIIVTCNENNLISKKIIESNGGLYEGSCETKNNERILRYRFE